MKIENFNERVDRHLVQRSVVPPIVGQFSRLLVAAAIVRGESRLREGHMLLANNEEPDERRPGSSKCLKLSGYFAPAYSSEDGGSWGVSVSITTDRLTSLIEPPDMRGLLANSVVGQSSSGDLLVILNLVDPGADSARSPSFNGKAFDAWKRLAVPTDVVERPS